jgi:transposase
LYVGIDVHKKQWCVCIRTEEFEHRTFTQPASPQVLHTYLQRNFPAYSITCAYEAGCFGYWISEQLQVFGYKCLVLNPGDIPGSDKENKRKTDHVDCRKIAREISKGELKGIYQPDVIQQSFRNLFRQRNQLMKLLRKIKCQIRSLLAFSGIFLGAEVDNGIWSSRFKEALQNLSISGNNKLALDSMLRRLNFLYDEFLVIEKQLRVYARSNHSDEYKRLLSIPGIGPVTSIAILSELGDLSRFKNIDNLSSYVGLVPNIYQSGETLRVNGITSRCHSLLRSYFIESAWTAVRRDPELILYYKKFVGKKSPNKIIIKVARKLFGRTYYFMKNKNEYKLNHKMSSVK